MSRQFGPTRGELWFRLWVSVGGLAFLGFALAYRGWPKGGAMIEIGLIAGVLFGGTLVWAGRRLIRRDHP